MILNVEAITGSREGLHLPLKKRLKVVAYEIAARHPLSAMLLARWEGINQVYSTPQEYQYHFRNSANTTKRVFQQLQERRLRRGLGV